MVKIDENGYPRGRVYHSDLIHRQIAYNEIYLKNKENYPLPFSKYQVHHKDHNKKNFNPENLILLTEEEHRAVHGIPDKDLNTYSKVVENKAIELLPNNQEEDGKEPTRKKLSYAKWKNDMGFSQKVIKKQKWKKMKRVPFWLKGKIRNGKAYHMGHGRYIFNGTFNKYFIDINKMLCCKASKYKTK